MTTSRVLSAGVGGLLGVLIGLVIVFRTAQGGWWLAAIPVVTATLGAVFRDRGIHSLARLIDKM
jgi:hypothetical protein